jgi:hypothetical protein
VPQYLLIVSRRPRQVAEPTARVAQYRYDQPFKRGPLSASVSGDTLTMEYGCADLADVRRCLADEGRRCNFVSWVAGLLDNVTLADGVDLA